MPGFDALLPDQKAVLQLLLKQGKSFEQIAGLLRMDAVNVRERALDALDALGADAGAPAGELTPERQDELADHLLGQQTEAQRAATRTFLEGSEPGRTWALAVAAELRAVSDAVPEIPGPAPAAPQLVDDPEEAAAFDDGREPTSRRGGVLLLAAVGLIIAFGIVLLVRGGSEDDTAADATPAAATRPVAACALPSGVTSLAGATGATGDLGTTSLRQQQVNLAPPEGTTSKARGYALLTEGGLALQAEGLKRDPFGYKVWLWNSRTEAVPLGFAIYDKASERYAGAVPALPKAADGCGALVLTRERAGATEPGPVVLAGAIKR